MGIEEALIMDEKEQLILEMQRLTKMLEPNAVRDEYPVYLKIKRILELIVMRLDETER